jgi:hypothetical protein
VRELVAAVLLIAVAAWQAFVLFDIRGYRRKYLSRLMARSARGGVSLERMHPAFQKGLLIFISFVLFATSLLLAFSLVASWVRA